jgi:nicotinamide-nucleotide amidase
VKDSDKALQRLSERVGRRLLKQGGHLATAESCTGGWIAKVITDIAGCSQWFLEGFVTYSDAAKVSQLRVPRSTLKAHGAVSEQTVRAMAIGALRRSGAQATVAVTGIAGPGGAVAGKPVGTVWLGWATRHGKTIRVRTQLKRFRGDREEVRRKTVRTALQGVLAR